MGITPGNLLCGDQEGLHFDLHPSLQVIFHVAFNLVLHYTNSHDSTHAAAQNFCPLFLLSLSSHPTFIWIA